MATITIKNIPEEIYKKIKLQAQVNHRSVNSEIISIFEHAIQKRTSMDAKKILERARKVRKFTAHHIATAEEIERWINRGRE